jgi:cytochrome c2
MEARDSERARLDAARSDSAAARATDSLAQAPPISGAEPGSDTSAAAVLAVTPADSLQLVQRGAQLFGSKGCNRCHTIGEGYRDGPDLEGIAQRKSYAWIAALLTDTEEMIQTDPELQQLRMEHFLDMPNLNLTPAEVGALYFYLRAGPPSGKP